MPPTIGRGEPTQCAHGYADVVGHVFEAKGQPVSMVRVHAALAEDFGESLVSPVQLGASEGPDGGTFGALSDAEGVWKLRCVRQTHLRLLAVHPAHAPTPFDWKPGRDTEVKLDRGIVVAGSFVTAAGKPVRNGKVFARPLERNPLALLAADEARLDDAGRFTTPPLARGRYLIQGRIDAYRWTAQELVVSDRLPPRVKLVLRLGSISGRLVEPDGTPAAGVVVRAISEQVTDAIRRLDCGTVEGSEGITTVSAADGRFTLSGLSLGDRLVVTAEGSGWTQAKGVRTGDSNVLLVRSATAALISIRGRLETPNMQPAFLSYGIESPVRLAHDQSFDLPFLLDRSRLVRIFARGAAALEFRHPEPENGVVTLGTVRLRPERLLSIGAVAADTGALLTGFTIRLDDPLWRDAQSAPGPARPLERVEKRVVMWGIGHGRVAGVAKAEGYFPARFQVPDGQTTLIVRLEPRPPPPPAPVLNGEAVLKVTYPRVPEGEEPRRMALAGAATVPDFRSGDDFGVFAPSLLKADACGRDGCVFTRLSPGRYSVIAAAGRFNRPFHRIWVAAVEVLDGDQRLDLSLLSATDSRELIGSER